ncbi:AAA family ATPase [uncultured Clostridium sp.]|uniref:AAA family ATPase n=1 Tax=uncultured Clostridium sp. TaxID=59620 RepID=UPI00262A143C|nr:AAA family ATPase [uncultured Clostridium sp.]
MKIRNLIINAFGPYGGEVKLDFAKNLDKDNMFVIAGNTGAGKTTIFDAINFALYGEASGQSRDTKGFRSNFAKEDSDTFVDLTFSLKGNEYRIRRSPEYMRKKKIGEGLAMSKPKASLDINGGEAFENGKTITGYGKVTEAITNVLGINSAQFKQLVMIPQGEFKRLLEAKSDEKEKIFRKIFGTEIINTFQEKMREKANKIKGNTEGLKKLRDAKARDYILKEGSEIKPLLDSKELNIELLLEKFSEEIKEDKKVISDKEEIKKAKTEEIEELLKVHSAIKTINEQIDEMIKIEIEVKTLLLGQEENRKREEEKNLASKAISVLMKEEILNKIEKDFILSKERLEALEKERETLNEKHDKGVLNFNKADDEAKEIKVIDKELDGIKELKDKSLIFEKKQNEIKIIEKDINISKETIKDLEENKEKDKKSIKAAEDYIEKCSKDKDRKVQLEAKKSKLLMDKKEVDNLLRDITTTLDIDVKLKIKGQDYIRAKEQVDSREKMYKEAEDILFRSQAGILAKDLQEGMECPVCGSKNHPKKAKLEDTNITKDKVDNLKKLYEEVNTAFVELKTEISTIKDSFDEKEKEVKIEALRIFDMDKEKLDAYEGLCSEKLISISSEGNEVLKELKEIDNNLSKEGTIKNRLDVLNKALEAKEKALEENKEKINSLNIKLVEANKEIEEIQKRFNGEIKPVKELEDREDELTSKKVSLEKMLASAKEMLELIKGKLNNILGNIEGEKTRLKDLEEEKKKALEEFNLELNRNEFESKESYLKAKRSREEIKGLELLIDNYNKELNEKRGSLETQKKNLEGKEKGDLEEVAVKGKATRIELNEVDKEIKEWTSKLDNNKKVVEDIKKFNKDMEKDMKEFAIVGEVSKIVNGDNEKKITLERYILAAYLDDILKAANRRLLKMTNDRYRLLRKKDIGDKRTSQGLDLQVFDVYSNKERDVSSLSGGESFKASLAMALGLSDVVQNSAGGIQLDTIFIDEGFGTLDQESLEAAIDILSELQGGGRIVGVISHVAELKDRIPKKIIVSGNRDGSLAEFRS